MKRVLLCFGLLLLLMSVAAAEDTTKTETKETTKVEKMESEKAADTTKKEPEWIKTESGLQYRDMVVGEGVVATDRMPVECHYTLWASDSTGTVGKKVQSSKDGGRTFHCTIGRGLIKGWSEGMVGMKEGGTRQLIIPPHIGYGQRGMPPAIAPNATLLFEIDFIKQDKK
jgi:FKBP-type peptidyl-prolyl cis-trans isomerase